MNYKVYILFHILHSSNLGWIITYMGEEEPNGTFMDTWLDSPYIYDIYDTNDGDSMKFMTQVRYECWKYWHTNMSGLNRASYRSNFGVGEGQEDPTQIWEKRQGEERGHMS